MKTYTGIGSRKTPTEIKMEMVYIADRLQKDYTLRSGGADGADTAFEMGVTNENKEIYIPWKGFNKSTSTLYNIPTDAFKVAKEFHSRWEYLSQAAQKLMARNVCQVLGQSMIDPVEFVICWTEDACTSDKTRTKATGGTGQAISIADYWDIPIINMRNVFWKEQLNQIIQESYPTFELE